MFPGPPFLAVPLRALSFRQTASLGVKRSPRIRRGARPCAPTAVLPAFLAAKSRDLAQRFLQTRRATRPCAPTAVLPAFLAAKSRDRAAVSPNTRGRTAVRPNRRPPGIPRCQEPGSRSGFPKHAGAHGRAPQPPSCRHSSLPRAGTAQRFLQTRRGALLCAPTAVLPASSLPRVGIAHRFLQTRRGARVCAPTSSQSASLSAESQNRTGDTAIFSRVLYQLSYLGQRRHCTQAVGGCQASAWQTGSPHMTLVPRRVQ